MKNKIKYNSSDSWLLLAIVYADIKKGGADLMAIISTGDYIMHAIFSIQELNAGIQKLLAGDFIKMKNNLFFPTIKTIKAFSLIDKKYKTVMRQLEEIEKILQKGGRTISSIKNNFHISHEEFDEVIERYHLK